MTIFETLHVLEDTTTLLKAVANTQRLKIICILSDGEKSVGELENLISLSQSALSQHLARLRRDYVLQTRRDAQTIYYSIENEEIPNMLKCACNLVKENKPD